MLNGHLLNERYQIKETIGGGGMANVYLARDIILERDVAIKVLRLDYANDEEFIARFHREAQAATSLNHPNIVNIYDVGEEDNILFMAMEYVDGMTLKEYIQQNGPIAARESLDILKQISSAIAHAHENEIVHRDIKPQNILIDTYGQVKVTDFGIAVALSATTLTQTNSILGSVHYLSPEQARGGMATKRSDVYLLGIVLYELLTGRLPFFGQTAVAIALKHLQRDTPSVRRFNQEIPQSVENIVLKATAKDPFHRYQTVEQVEEAIEKAFDPDKRNEAKYTPPVETGEETKAIPIITDDQADTPVDQDTIVHSANGETKPYTTEENSDTDGNKKKKKRKWPFILLIILLVLLSSAIAAFFIFQPGEVAIPDVADMEYEDAAEKLKDANLQYKKELQSDDDVEEGLVIKTDPRSGKSVKEKSTVTVFVSQGKEKSSFSDYVGENFEQTKDILEEEGFNVFGYEKHSEKPEGEITNQIQPDPDEEVAPGETRVIFEYSDGPALTSLDNLKDMSEDEAEEYLDGKNLKMNTKEQHSDSVEEGMVIKQEPSPETELTEGETVDVYVSTGPDEKSPASKTIDFTVDYKPENADDEDEDEGDSREQTVKVYIDDMNHSISEVAEEQSISQDTEFTITLTIEPGEEAEYKVVRDDDVVMNKTVPYEEGE